MTRLLWNAPGERFYETGVDRGVLYPDGRFGVAWNGLTSVREAAAGGAPTPYYIDGFKYLSVAAAEEFKATIEAFSSPAEFAICDGTRPVSNGLFVTQQPRVPFAMSYRTGVGNDLVGLDHGYKLHLVYNAFAQPANRDNSTLTDSTSPLNLSWTISTTPPRVSGIRPTAHFIIDSRYTPEDLLSGIEDFLYGTDSLQPYIPTVPQLMELFNNYGQLS